MFIKCKKNEIKIRSHNFEKKINIKKLKQMFSTLKKCIFLKNVHGIYEKFKCAFKKCSPCISKNDQCAFDKIFNIYSDTNVQHIFGKCSECI